MDVITLVLEGIADNLDSILAVIAAVASVWATLRVRQVGNEYSMQARARTSSEAHSPERAEGPNVSVNLRIGDMICSTESSDASDTNLAASNHRAPMLDQALRF